jgi:PAS domain S-box-containing protein
MQVIHPLLLNASLLLAMGLIYDLAVLSKGQRRSPVQQSLQGCAIGLICIALMSAPFELHPGLIFDTRSVLLSACALFFGTIPTLVAMAASSLFRGLQGGIGSTVGVSVILTSGALGLLARRLHGKPMSAVSVGQLFLLGFVVHVAMLLWMLILPKPVATATIAAITLPVLVIYPATTVAIGMVLRNRTRWHEAIVRLRDRENYANLLFARSPLPQLVLHAESHKISDCNHAAVAAFGVDRTDDLVGETVDQWTARPEDRVLHTLLAERPDEEARFSTGEVSLALRKATGLQWEAQPWITRVVREGQPYIHLSLVDTTESSRARKELQESEERLRLALTSGKQGLYDLNLETGQATVNDEYARMLGYEPEEFTETIESAMHRLHPDDCEYVAQTHRDYLQGKNPEYRAEFRLRTKNGGWVWVLSLGRVVEYDAQGKPLRMLGTHTNLTEQKREAQEKLETLQALWDSETRFQKAITEAPIPIMLHAEDGEVVLVSDAWCEISGYNRDELSTTADWFRLAYGDRAADVDRQVTEVYKLESRTNEGDFRIRTRDGEERIWSFNSGPLGTLGDGRRLVITTVTDVTERNAAEAEIQTLNANLERRVHERTLQLRAAYEELESFSSAVSHDLRAPVRAIGSFSQMLDDQIQSCIDDSARHYLSRIRQNAGKMAILIDELLSHSRVSRQPLRREPLDISQMAQECLELVSAADPALEANCAIQPGMTAVADKGLSRIVMMNLLENAWKFSSRKPTRKIEVGSNPNGGDIVYFVRDNGAGFDMVNQELLFLPFRRLHPDTEFPGTGIGLATVHRIVQRHGGRIWAESTPDNGATFYWTLAGTDQ